MSPNFLKCIASVLAREAGYQCDHEDPGNYTGGVVGVGVLVGTNLGISAPVLREWRGHTVMADDMRALTKEEAEAIYEARYWAPIRGDELPLALAFVTLDAVVMSGMGGIDPKTHINHKRAAAWLQEAVGVDQDGHIGAATIAAAANCDQARAVRMACLLRLNYLMTLPTWAHFGRGWQTRVDTVQGAALALIP